MRNIFRWSIENFDTFLAIILCIIAGIFGTFGILQNALLPAAAGVLSLISISIIRDRKNRDSLNNEVLKLKETLEESLRKPSADQFFVLTEFDSQLIQKAKEEIWLLQETGARIVEENYKYLEEFINKGGKVAIVITGESKKIDEMIAFRNHILSASALASRRAIAKEKIKLLSKAVSGASGSLEVREILYPIDINMILIDPESKVISRREGLVRMVGFKNYFEDKLDFNITFKNEQETYRHFVQQYKEMWDQSVKVIL